MASYKINGYDLLLAFGILPDQDKATADSFESPPDVEAVYSYDWGNGIIEYDLTIAPPAKPRVLTIKGTLVAESIDKYLATKMAISTVLYENYVTIEETDLGLKYNAKLRPGGLMWHRLTNLSDPKILVAVQFEFDEVKQDVPYKDHGQDDIVYLVDNQRRFYNTQDNKYIIL